MPGWAIGLIIVGAVLLLVGIILNIRFIFVRYEKKGIKVDAVVTRIEERDSSSKHYSHYVKYKTPEGEEVEAYMSSGKVIERPDEIGRMWHYDLQIGSKVRVAYLPKNPKHVVRVYYKD